MADPTTPAALSPLAEAVPESLDELFSRDPLSLTQQDLDKIIANLREARARWAAAEASGAKSAPRSAKAAAGPKVAAKPGMSLDDLGL